MMFIYNLSSGCEDGAVYLWKIKQPNAAPAKPSSLEETLSHVSCGINTVLYIGRVNLSDGEDVVKRYNT